MSTITVAWFCSVIIVVRWLVNYSDVVWLGTVVFCVCTLWVKVSCCSRVSCSLQMCCLVFTFVLTYIILFLQCHSNVWSAVYNYVIIERSFVYVALALQKVKSKVCGCWSIRLLSLCSSIQKSVDTFMSALFHAGRYVLSSTSSAYDKARSDYNIDAFHLWFLFCDATVNEIVLRACLMCKSIKTNWCTT